jgi:hypothetical protein
MIEALSAGYESAFSGRGRLSVRPEPVHVAITEAVRRSWRQLARERIERSEVDDPALKAFLTADRAGGEGAGSALSL